MNKDSKELLTAKPLQILIKLSLPAILGMIVIGLYPLMDGIFAGQILGEKAMTAVGIDIYQYGYRNFNWGRFSVTIIQSHWRRKSKNNR